MESLEQINGETCVKHVRALRNVVLTEDELRCRNCSNHNQECYKPIKYFEIPLNPIRYKQ